MSSAHVYLRLRKVRYRMYCESVIPRIIYHQIFLLIPDWSKHVTWLFFQNCACCKKYL